MLQTLCDNKNVVRGYESQTDATCVLCKPNNAAAFDGAKERVIKVDLGDDDWMSNAVKRMILMCASKIVMGCYDDVKFSTYYIINPLRMFSVDQSGAKYVSYTKDDRLIKNVCIGHTHLPPTHYNVCRILEGWDLLTKRWVVRYQFDNGRGDVVYEHDSEKSS